MLRLGLTQCPLRYHVEVSGLATFYLPNALADSALSSKTIISTPRVDRG